MIAIGSDHGGFHLKQEIMRHLADKGIESHDYGTYSEESCDYPDFGEAVGRAVASGECERGIVICGTGIGIGIAANKIHGIRAALCTDCYSARMAKEHNNANVITFGGRTAGVEHVWEMVKAYMAAEHLGGTHAVRVEKIHALER